MKILLATDGSEFSRAAIDECKKYIESGLATEVKIVSVYEAQVPIASEPFVIASDCYQKLNDFAHDRTRDAARQAREILSVSLSLEGRAPSTMPSSVPDPPG